MNKVPELFDARNVAGALTVVDILDRLIGCDTDSSKSNLDLMRWVVSYLEGCGATVEILPGTAADKVNLFATLGSGGIGGVMLSGHTDVVPAPREGWATDPFRLARDGNRLVGRGAVDMKGFIACVLGWAGGIDVRTLRTPVHIALSCDEELGCLGIPHLIEKFGRSLPTPRIAIVGEPTMMVPAVAHKGYRTFRTSFDGRAAHASRLDDGVSAIRLAAYFVQALDILGDELQRLPDPDMPVDRPWTTVSAGLVSGGTAINVVPGRSVVEWEMRTVGSADASNILARIDEILASILPADLVASSAAQRMVTAQLAEEPMFFEPHGDALRLVSGLLHSGEIGACSFGTEAGFFQRAGISTVVLGPGDPRQAHRTNEYIELAQLEAASQFLSRLGQRLEAGTI